MLKSGGKNIGVPYEIRTRVTAVKERRPIVIQRNFAAWIALYRTLRTHGNAYWTFNGRATSKRWQEMSQRKLAELEALIDQMKTMQRLLERIQNCRCDALDECGKRLLAQVGAKDLLANATLLNQLSKQKTHRQE